MILGMHLLALDMHWLTSSVTKKRSRSSSNCSRSKKTTQPAEWGWRLFCGKRKSTTTRSSDLSNWPIQDPITKTDRLLIYFWETFTANKRNGRMRAQLD